MSRFIVAFVLSLFIFGIVLSAIAGKGEPISCYKWFYNHLDGYVADSGNIWARINSVKRENRYFEEHQEDRRLENNHYRLEINRRLLFSNGKIKDKTLVADKL
jgi:hypothetical protein